MVPEPRLHVGQVLDNPVPVRDLASVPGLPPDLLALPKGCAFAARCSFRTQKCVEEKPTLVDIPDKDQSVACWQWEEIAGIK